MNVERTYPTRTGLKLSIFIEPDNIRSHPVPSIIVYEYHTLSVYKIPSLLLQCYRVGKILRECLATLTSLCSFYQLLCSSFWSQASRHRVHLLRVTNRAQSSGPYGSTRGSGTCGAPSIRRLTRAPWPSGSTVAQVQ